MSGPEREAGGLLGQLERAADALGLADCSVLVAVSGGLDSMVLAHALVSRAADRRLALSFGHVNHGLRGAESEADEAAVAELAALHGVPFRSRRVDVASLREGVSSRARPTVQEAARRLRRAALEGMRSELGADCVATGHHADDQVETVVMRLLRGGGPDAMGGISERSVDGRIVRPLLRVSRQVIRAYAEEREIPWREDASNADVRYTRNRLRRNWLPGLAREFNPQLLRAIGDLAEAQRRDSEWLESLTEAEARERFRCLEAGLSVTSEGWHDLPEALARRLVRRAVFRMDGGRELSRAHLMRVLAFLRGGRVGTTLELPGGLLVERRLEAFEFRRTPLD